VSTTAEPLEVHKLVDTIIPRETAQRALLYDRLHMGGEDPVYSLQRAATSARREGMRMPETPDGGWLLDDTPFVYTKGGETRNG